jgi:hypothetical protein
MLRTEDLFVHGHVVADDATHESPTLGITFNDPVSPATSRALRPFCSPKEASP